MGTFSDYLSRYFLETPQDILDKEWEEIKDLNNIGPDVLAYAEYIKEESSHLINSISTVDNCPKEPFSPDSLYYLAA